MQGNFRIRLVLISLSCVVLVLMLLGNQNVTPDSYSQIRAVIKSTPKSRVLEISPDLNSRYFPWINQIPAANRSFDPAKNDSRFMRAASMGAKELSKFLVHEGITHLLIAQTGLEKNRIFYRWGMGPSVDVVLTKPLFHEVAVASGEFPATLYEVENVEIDDFCSECQGVRLEWSGVRESAINTTRYGYVDGPDIVWILGEDRPTLRLMSNVNSGFRYRVSFEIVPAYGNYAPPQILKFQTEDSSRFERIGGGFSKAVSVELETGEELAIHSVLPCMVPAVAQLEIGNLDTRELCFGISKIKVEEIQ